MLVPLLLVSLSYCLAFCGASALPSPQGQSDGRTYSVQSAADRAEVVAVTILEKGGTHWMFVINEYAGMQAVRQNFCYDDESTSIKRRWIKCFENPKITLIDGEAFTYERLSEFIGDIEQIHHDTVNTDPSVARETFSLEMLDRQYNNHRFITAISFRVHMNGPDGEVVAHYSSNNVIGRKPDRVYRENVFYEPEREKRVLSPYVFVESQPHRSSWKTDLFRTRKIEK